VGDTDPTQVCVTNLSPKDTETNPVSVTLCLLQCRTMDRVQKRSNSDRYTTLSEPFRISLHDVWCYINETVLHILSWDLHSCISLLKSYVTSGVLKIQIFVQVAVAATLSTCIPEGARFESLPGYRISRLRYFVVVLSLYGYMP
jgi:hypothetical protein